MEYKGKVSKIIYQLKGGLKSSMGYIGAKKLTEIKKNAKFIKITKAGFYESMVHSVETIEPTLNFKQKNLNYENKNKIIIIFNIAVSTMVTCEYRLF